jgi:hypothetical protein|tara:strand:- start:6225 stop:6815 length:591 start_codon:yes stop_codon:yes gene_type:complete
MTSKSAAVSKERLQAISKRQRDSGTKLTNNSALGEIAILAEKQLSLEDTIEGLEAELKEKKRLLEEVATKLLPDAMTAIGIEDFTMTSGAKLAIKSFYSASISADNKEKAHTWLRNHQFGSLIKNQFGVDFGQGEGDKADKFRGTLLKNKSHFSEKEGVHASTLKAFVKEQIEGGSKVPLELFGAFVGRKAKIKRP